MHNGELLDVAEQEGYDLLMTTDHHLRYRQRLAVRQLAIIVLLSTERIMPGGTKKLPCDEAAPRLVHGQHVPQCGSEIRGGPGVPCGSTVM